MVTYRRAVRSPKAGPWDVPRAPRTTVTLHPARSSAGVGPGTPTGRLSPRPVVWGQLPDHTTPRSRGPHEPHALFGPPGALSPPAGRDLAEEKRGRAAGLPGPRAPRRVEDLLARWRGAIGHRKTAIPRPCTLGG